MSAVFVARCAEEEVPADDGWLAPEEQRVLARFPIEKRRREWRLGRWTAKRVLLQAGLAARTEEAAVLAADDGAPEAWIGGRRVARPVLSLSHREGVAAAALHDDPVGCDLEWVEPRSLLFVSDFFTEGERARYGTDREIAVCWSAKESALKVVRAGLRRDTRSVEVMRLEEALPWGRVLVEDRLLGCAYSGWWRPIRDRHVLTVLTAEATEIPRLV